MANYSYSKEITQNNILFYELDLERVRKMFTKIFATYNPRVREDSFDSFCEDFYILAKEINGSNERIWRMILTDMFFNYDERGFLESTTTDNKIKRKQFAIIASAVTSRLRTDRQPDQG
ncbi:MAG: hypothetical protein HFG62_08635 [Lachnospiraceae bacterium]|jgi:hypothetical protein|nr:hypothetical protein [Lachnospiraceae bacterium]MCI8959171.1 hypothetical protein [Lachnospiraceae bacterium]